VERLAVTRHRFAPPRRGIRSPVSDPFDADVECNSRPGAASITNGAAGCSIASRTSLDTSAMSSATHMSTVRRYLYWPAGRSSDCRAFDAQGAEVAFDLRLQDGGCLRVCGVSGSSRGTS